MEPPDFEQIARVVAKPHSDRWDEDGDGNVIALSACEDDLAADIEKALREVWNARGAADREALRDAVLDAGPLAENLARVLKRLDR
jgi:hypothetical protein